MEQPSLAYHKKTQSRGAAKGGNMAEVAVQTTSSIYTNAGATKNELGSKRASPSSGADVPEDWDVKVLSLRVAVRNNCAACLLKLAGDNHDDATGGALEIAPLPEQAHSETGLVTVQAAAERDKAKEIDQARTMLEEVVQLCTEALDLECGQQKALYRRGLAKRRLGGEENLQSALADLQEALRINPNARDVVRWPAL